MNLITMFFPASIIRQTAFGKQSSMPVSKDAYLNGFNLNAFYAIVKYLSQN